ncbi:MAG: thioredoxin domain-containing protein [Deltaproteobacteria bacterium]|nr:thioredoxin domain-containing protein [Deltaproteobacteria bacterium]
MQLPRHSLFAAIFLGLSLITMACSASDQIEPADPSDANSPVVASLGGTPITQADLDQWIMEDYLASLAAETNPSKVYEIRANSLNAMIDQRLLEAEAAKAGLSVPKLLAREQGDAGPITDEEVQQFYTENARRLGAVPLEQVSEQIRSFLSTTRDVDFRDTYLRTLRAENDVRVLLSRPRIEVAATGITIGPDDAVITIIEFTDYQCPFCERAEPTMQQVIATYPDQVRWVYRHFPLTSMHPQASDAAKAAICADRQDKFIGVHRALFQNKRNLSPERLVAIAGEQSLDVPAFETCFGASEVEEQVTRDLAEGQAAGVSGTPAFFLNGISFSGAKPFEEFDKLIQEELARIETVSTNSSSNSSAN